MEDEDNVGKSIPDHIIQKTLDSIREKDGFDDETVAGIERLWRNDGLRQAERIMNVIRPKPDEDS